MRKLWSLIKMAGVLGLFLVFGSSVNVYADGTEMLGPPLGITVASGSGIASGGTGMVTQPGTINVNVPPGAIVKQVLLYWEGVSIEPAPGDNVISVNGNDITGDLIGGPAFFFTIKGNNIRSSSFRADITSLGLITPGLNTLTVDGMSYNYTNNGAGILVIYEQGTETADIQVRDGLDLAFINFPEEERQSTVLQTFTIAPADVDRVAQVLLLVGSVYNYGTSITDNRPNSIEVNITVGGVTTPYVYSDFLLSNDGLYWDSVMLDVFIPIGATELAVQIFSRDDLSSGNLPASFEWVGGVVSVPIPAPPVPPDPDPSVCGTATSGFWKNHPDEWPVDSVIIGGKEYSKDDAASIMKKANKGDKCFTMFKALVTAKVNVSAGNPSECIDATITDADIWMDAWCINEPEDFSDDHKRTVSGRSAAWRSGGPLNRTLDEYNRGLLCADHCDGKAEYCNRPEHDHSSRRHHNSRYHHDSGHNHRSHR